MPSWTSPRASARTLPISRVIARARRSLCCAMQLAESVEDLAALRGRRRAPGREGDLGCLDRHPGIRRGTGLEPADDVATIGWVDALEGHAGDAVDPLPRDEVTEHRRFDSG